MDSAKISVLLVDDDAIINIVHQKFLEKTGAFHPIRFVNSATKALDILKNDDDPPDLLLLDIRMPVMNGFEFLDAFGALPGSVRSRIKIVMLTSSLDFSDKDRAMKSASVVDYLDKPLDRAKIERLIQRYESAVE